MKKEILLLLLLSNVLFAQIDEQFYSNQEQYSALAKEIPETGMELITIVNLSNLDTQKIEAGLSIRGEQNDIFVADFNFDGNNDFSLYHMDDGWGVYEVHRIFLFDEKQGLFTELDFPYKSETSNYDCSCFCNINLDSLGGYLISSCRSGPRWHYDYWHIDGLAISSVKAETLSRLTLPSEELIFSFETEKGKTLALSHDVNMDYLVYRYGTANNIELGYPANLEMESWNKFKYFSYLRGGGPSNAGMDLNFVCFINGDYKYIIYNNYYSETETYDIGVRILNLNTAKEFDIKGKKETQQGSLVNLRDQELIEVDENFSDW